MKQKNLILIVVAVVCGAVAAVLVATQLSAKGTKAAKVEEMVDIPVAARDIAIGTRIPAKDVEQYFTMKKFPKEALPQAYVADTQEIVDKRTMRPIRMGETLNPADISATGFIQPPDGHSLMTAPITLERGASGFALPGTRVTVLATKKSQKKNMDIVFPLFVDILVLAVDTFPSAPPAQPNGQGGGQPGQGGGATAAGFQNMSMVSFAVTPEDSVLMNMAADGATLRFALPDQDEKKKDAVVEEYKKMRPSTDKIRKIFGDDWSDEKPTPSEDPTPKVEVLKVKVPTEKIEEGTEITDELLEKKFKLVDFPKTFVVDGAAYEDKDLIGKFAVADLAAGMIAPKDHLAKTKKAKVNPVVSTGEFAATKTGVPENDVAYPKADTDTLPVPARKEYTYVKIVTPQGTVVHKYEVTAKGNVYVGVVTPGLDNE